MNRTIVVTGIEPAPLSFRHPLGLDLDLSITMRKQNGDAVDPTLAQFVLLPKSRGGILPYDMQAHDISQGIAHVEVPGTALMDQSGYNIELYARVPNAVSGDPAKPVALAARGVLRTEGSAYSSHGPLNMINVPVVTGPAGPVGPAGARGAIWFTGTGTPTMTLNVAPGDMYLDEVTGDVWRYDGAVWTRGVF